mmetsp:Transcript_26177/g.32104  ORF Transcript_26177/g.32104 Transcript_26177/m.32104 type:complete len:254 (+) Transcript_26177:232-993(+)
MNTIEEIKRLNDIELKNGSVNTSASWHNKYSKCAWVFVGNISASLSEGDIICIMSQFGEVEDINLVRDKMTGESKRFAFVKYEDARSCILAVDNFCGTMVLEQSMRVDHVERYRLPKHLQEKEESDSNGGTGETPSYDILKNGYNINEGEDLFSPQIKTNDDNRLTETDQKKSLAKTERRRAKAERKERRGKDREEKERKRALKTDRKRKFKSNDKKEKIERGKNSKKDYRSRQAYNGRRDRSLSSSRSNGSY